MEKPRKFFHREVRKEEINGQMYKIGYLHAGRVQISVEAVVLLVLAILGVLFVTQIVLGFVTGWTVWWPGQFVLSVLALAMVITILRWIVLFIMYIASEVTINGPDTEGKD